MTTAELEAIAGLKITAKMELVLDRDGKMYRRESKEEWSELSAQPASLPGRLRALLVSDR